MQITPEQEYTKILGMIPRHISSAQGMIIYPIEYKIQEINKMDKTDRDDVAKQLGLVIKATVGEDVILSDGRVGHFKFEAIQFDLSSEEKMAITKKKLPSPINERAFILSESEITAKSYVFVQTNQEETGTAKPATAVKSD